MNIKLYLKIFKFWMKRKNPLFEIFMKDKKVLDIGCGEGEFLRLDTEKIYGIDINKTIIDKLKREGLKIKYGNVVDIPFENNFFDVIYCSNVIEHLFPTDAYKMFKEMKRVLKKNNIIIVISPMPSKIWNTFGHIKPYPPSAIKKLFREISRESFDSISGLVIENVFYYGIGSNKLTFIISTFLAQFFNFFRGAYLIVIKKNEK